MPPQILSVSALNKYVHSILDEDPFLLNIAIRGEISNMHHNAKSGHRYFTLKDGTASVKAVLFKNSADDLAFYPEDGMQVIARCKVSLYERDGAFQLYVDHLFPDGVGAAQMAFEQLKARLEAEGLFDVERKLMLPAYPNRIALITSKTGAVLQDIRTVAQRRCPTVHFLLLPVTVQGESAAAKEIASAITLVSQQKLADVMIIARGGGSSEDLSVFNHEEIARAVYASEIPVVSAIGHETDFTILDFAADLRAPTPSAAAEIVLPNLQDDLQNMMNIYINISNNIHSKLNSCYNSMHSFIEDSSFDNLKRFPQIQQNLLYEKTKFLKDTIFKKMKFEENKLAQAASLATILNPYAVLARGYAVAQNKNGEILRSVKQIKPNDTLTLSLQDGKVACITQEILSQMEK